MIYILEDCAYLYLFHWVVFMLGSLRRIPKNEDDTPVKIYLDMPKIQSYNLESLQIIKDAYEFVKPKNGDEIRFHKGESLIKFDLIDVKAYSFLRELFNSRIIPRPIEKRRLIYISRNDSVASNPANQGRKIRNILNEEEIKPLLINLGFEIICLSELSFEGKIRLFQEATMIVSPHGSGLVFSLFANTNCKIVEILPKGICDHDHYKYICEHLRIPYYRFTDVTTTGEVHIHKQWNMTINIPQFISYLQNLI